MENEALDRECAEWEGEWAVTIEKAKSGDPAQIFEHLATIPFTLSDETWRSLLRTTGQLMREGPQKGDKRGFGEVLIARLIQNMVREMFGPNVTAEVAIDDGRGGKHAWT